MSEDLASEAGAFLRLGSHPCEACGADVIGDPSLCLDCSSVREYICIVEASTEVPEGQVLSRWELVRRWLEAI